MELQHVLQAHPGNCICIEFDPTGKVSKKQDILKLYLTNIPEVET